MNCFDITILIVFGVCLMAGIYRGPLKEFFSLSGLYAGAYVAFKYYVAVGKWLSEWISNGAGFSILVFLIVFCEIYIIIILLGIIVRHLIKTEPSLRTVRVFGGIMGSLRGIFTVSAILIALIAVLPKGISLIEKSILCPYVAEVSEAMAEIVSGEMKNEFTDKLADLKKVWSP